MNNITLIRFVSFVILTSSTVRGETPPTWEQVPAILARIIPAKFPDKQFDVTTYGAKGDGQTDCLKAIRDAIDVCSKAGGGRVVVPAGQFLCNGPIHLKSHVNCTFKRGTPGGVSIGSEMSGDVRNVFIEKCKMGSVNRPIYIKSNPDRGGIVENIWARDMTVDSCTILFNCEMNYKRVTQGPSMPAFRDVHIENIACKKAAKAIDCQGLPDNPIRNVSIRNMTVDSAPTPLKTEFVEGFRMENVKVNGVIVTPGSN